MKSWVFRIEHVQSDANSEYRLHAMLADCWQRLTGVWPEEESDFFADGGTSLDLMRMIESIKSECGVTVDFAKVCAVASFLELIELVVQSAGPPSPATAGRAALVVDGRPFVRVRPADADFGPHQDSVSSWLREYISQPHDDLGRSGPICPFVPSAVRDDDLQFSFRYDVGGLDGPPLRRILLEEMLEFSTFGGAAAKATSREARLVIMPQTGPDDWRRLDDAYPQLKDFAVKHGLMIGQFHPECDERAARNPDFAVSVSPVCLLAIRRMAPHDVLFLGSRPDWFERYDELFGGHYERGRVRDPLMRRLYQETSEQYTQFDSSISREFGGI